jgi:rhamnose transport system permease protein
VNAGTDTSSGSTQQTGAFQSLARTLARQREASLFVLIVVLVLLIAVRAPEYVAYNNLENLLTNASFLIILVLGQLAVLLTRGIDLSQASVLAFSGMFLAQLSQVMPDLPVIAFIALSIAMGAVLGAVNGVSVSLFGIPPIIATLGSMAVYRGLIFLLSGGAWISAHEMSETFKAFPMTPFIGIPNIIWVAAIIAVLFWLLLVHTQIGRNIYAVGGNPSAARFAGISRRRVEMLVYILSGAVAGLTGYLWTARFAIAYTQAAEGREFAIIAACVIGGVSIAGGKGTVVGAILGAFLIAIVETALPFLRVNPFLQLAILGAVILVAVAANARAERKPGRQILARDSASAAEPGLKGPVGR